MEESSVEVSIRLVEVSVSAGMVELRMGTVEESE